MFDLGTAERQKLENLWAILQESANELGTVPSVEQLTRQVQKTWTQISSDVHYTGGRHAGRHSLLHHE